MDFHKSLFWICFITIMKITFIVYDCNPIRYKSMRYFGTVIWKNIAIEIRSIKTFDALKTEIRKWKPKNC